MTKARAPLTAELALTRIADVTGWHTLAEISGFSERTVRSWSDPDNGPKAEKAISLELALKFDVAYRAAGGEGSPLLQWFTTRLEAEVQIALADSAAIINSIAVASREHGEATAFALAAALPGASPAVGIRAELETEQAISALMITLASLRAGRMDEVATGLGTVTPAAQPLGGDYVA